MTSIIKFQAFSGIDDESPPCYLLQVDEFTFLLDCGWDCISSFDYLDNLIKYIPQINAVLLTYPDPNHLGALPYLVGKCGLQCPIYATEPVNNMGLMFMYDMYQSRHNFEEFDLFSLDDVDTAFGSITKLKYSQTVNLKGKGHGLQITPTVAGHMLGGTIWRIVKDAEEEIVYAIDYNHKKERHLNGCMLDEIGRPHILITDAFNANYIQSRRRQRDEQLMTKILQTMRANGNCLITVDTGGRVLELAQLLDQMWRSSQSGLMAYSLALLNHVSFNVIAFARSSVEWMSERIQRSFEDRRNNPFHSKHIRMCHSMEELSKIPEPKVVLCSGADLEFGFGKELFTEWCEGSQNSVIITQRPLSGTLSHKLLQKPSIRNITLEIKKRIKLVGEELKDYQEKMNINNIPKKEDINLNLVKQESSDSDSDMEDVEEKKNPTDNPVVQSCKNKYDLMRPDMRQQNKSGFFKIAKRGFPMYPCVDDKIKWDPYGEIAKPEDFKMFEALLPKINIETKEEITEEEEIQVVEVPSKCIRETKNYNVNASVVFIDFEGRSDGESIKKILAQMKPREMIIVHGSSNSTKSLAQFCRSEIVQGRVFEPRINEIIDATTDSHIYQIKLKEELVSSLKFSKAKDLELAWINARIDINSKEDGSYNMDIEGIPTLVKPDVVLSHESVFINEPKLSDFKLALQKADVTAEFVAGVLICNQTVAVKRSETGRLQIEGRLGENYYKIRDLLYKQYAII